MSKAKILVGYSKKGRRLANEVQISLGQDALLVVWDQTRIYPGETFLQAIIRDLGNSDLSVFVCAAEDLKGSNDSKQLTAVESSFFELGIFIGKLGLDKCYMVVPEGQENIHLPPQLIGMHKLTFDPKEEDIGIALGVACAEIRKKVDEICEAKQEQEAAPPLSEKPEEELESEGEEKPNNCIDGIMGGPLEEIPQSDYHWFLKFKPAERQLLRRIADQGLNLGAIKGNEIFAAVRKLIAEGLVSKQRGNRMIYIATEKGHEWLLRVDELKDITRDIE